MEIERAYCVFNYATFNLAITPIVVHNYTYAYVKAMKEAVLSTNIGFEESLKQLKRLRKDWEWHLKINKQRDDNKAMRACYFALFSEPSPRSQVTAETAQPRSSTQEPCWTHQGQHSPELNRTSSAQPTVYTAL